MVIVRQRQFRVRCLFLCVLFLLVCAADRDSLHCRSIQVSELSKLILDLGMGEGDVDLDTAVAEMEIDDMDDNMDGKLGKAEFMKWLAAKKQELADMEPEPTKKSSKPEKVKHVAADQNAWGDDPKHHAAAIKIQSVARGRKTRHEKDSHEEGEIVVLDPGLEEAQTKVLICRYVRVVVVLTSLLLCCCDLIGFVPCSGRIDTTPMLPIGCVENPGTGTRQTCQKESRCQWWNRGLKRASNLLGTCNVERCVSASMHLSSALLDSIPS